MDRDDWKSFHRWLDDATNDEIKSTREEIEALVQDLRDPGTRGTYKRMIKFIDEEIGARRELACLPSQRKRR